jgi:hypothetical protein
MLALADVDVIATQIGEAAYATPLMSMKSASNL